jgi:hypothetical protein
MMAMFVIFIGAAGLLLDANAIQIVTVQSSLVLAYLLLVLICEGISLRRDMRQQREA